MDDLNIELLLCCCTFCETYDEPIKNNNNNYSNVDSDVKNKLIKRE